MRTASTTLAAAACLAVPTAHAVPFTVQDITFADPAAFDVAQGRPVAPQFGMNTPAALNDHGDVVGRGFTGYGVSGGENRAGFYSGSAETLANIGNLAGDYGDPAGANTGGSSVPYGINNTGWVVGYSGNSPMIWRDADANHANSDAGEMQALALNPAATIGDARGVSHSGYVVVTGSGTNASSTAHRTRVDFVGGVATETETRFQFATGAISGGVAINDAGDVGYTLQGQGGGFVFRDMDTSGSADAGETFEIPQMSVFGSSRVYDINNAGQVLGTMKNANNKDVAFVWTDLDGDNQFTWADDGDGYFGADETSDEVVRFSVDGIGGIETEEGNTFAFAINDAGQAVGGYAVGSTRRAWLWDALQGVMLLEDVSDLGGSQQLRQAYDINAAGQTAVSGRLDGSTNGRTFLLTPVPEPTALSLLILSAWTCTTRRRHP